MIPTLYRIVFRSTPHTGTVKCEIHRFVDNRHGGSKGQLLCSVFGHTGTRREIARYARTRVRFFRRINWHGDFYATHLDSGPAELARVCLERPKQRRHLRLVRRA